MTAMTPEAAKVLRATFPKSAIGKLPRAGIDLDYVGHAAVTDRLLAVDPAWTWEPLALDDRGLPALDSKGNLWIRLTICGVTRIGVGDGKSAKEVIGDAIRNAAMRFGVALDLWSKEELEGSHDAHGEPVEGPHAAPPPPRLAPEPVEGGGGITTKQLGAMGAAFRDAGISERQDRLDFVARVTGDIVESSKDLTKAQASAVIDALKKAVEDAPQEPPLDGWPA